MVSTNIFYKPLKIEDILLESIDFHCFPNLITKIKERLEYKYYFIKILFKSSCTSLLFTKINKSM